MTIDFARWQHWMWIALGALCVLFVLYRIADRAFGRRRQRERIQAARGRSEFAALEVPTTRGAALHTVPASLLDAVDAEREAPLVVDEQPHLRIRYLDIYGKYVERTIEVEMLDLHRQAIIAKGDSLHDPRVYPLDRIAEASDAASGTHFNLGRWVEAVRVARRKRDVLRDSQVGALT